MVERRKYEVLWGGREGCHVWKACLVELRGINSKDFVERARLIGVEIALGVRETKDAAGTGQAKLAAEHSSVWKAGWQPTGNNCTAGAAAGAAAAAAVALRIEAGVRQNFPEYFSRA